MILCGGSIRSAKLAAADDVIKSFTAKCLWFWGGLNLLAALGITVWLAAWVRQLYQGNCLQGQNPRQSPAFDL